MFRAQTNPFDEAVVKATDENLTSENWVLILDVCDRVSGSPSGPQSAVAALIKRLAHRNANVQIYTLELANALSQNCGPPIHRELASRSFTDALLRLADDRTTHQQVKAKVLERMQGWTDMFSKDPDLGIMAQACDKLRRGNPGLEPPSKPRKQTMGDEDRRKEEEDLQMALALSLREKGAPAASNTGSAPAAEVAAPLNDAADSAATPRAGTTAATVNRVRALYDFQPSEPGELAFAKGDVIAVLESVYKDWWKGSLRGATGIFPLNYVEKLQDPTAQELEHDAETEAEVFAQIRNVEKLLALLSIRGEGRPGRPDSNEEEITELYHQTLAIRPKLIELIGKYSQKKDDFTILNEKFIKARRDYEALLDSSMSRPYGRPPPPGHPYPNAYGQPPPQQPYPVTPTTYSHPGRPQQVHAPVPYGAQTSQLPPSHGPPQGYPPQHVPGGEEGGPAPFHFLPGGSVPDPRMQSGPTPAPSVTPFQGEAADNRPHSIRPVNPGVPQELASGSVHEATAPSSDHAAHGRNSVRQPYNSTQQPSHPPPAQQAYQTQPYGQSMSPAPSQPYAAQQMSIRQRSESLEQSGNRQSYVAPQYQQPPQPSQPPQQQQQQSYPADQAYGQPPSAAHGYLPPGPQNGIGAAPQAGEDDVSDYYR